MPTLHFTIDPGTSRARPTCGQSIPNATPCFREPGHARPHSSYRVVDGRTTRQKVGWILEDDE